MILLPHQRDAVERMRGNSRGLFADPGLGKTRIALTLIAERDRPGLSVVALPPPATLSWEAEAEKIAFPGVIISLCGLTPKKRNERLACARELATHEIVVVTSSYETISEIVAGVERLDFAIADESHYIKSHDSARSKAARGWYDNRRKQYNLGLSDRATMRHTMTGTPIMHSPLDLWSQMRFVSKDILPESWWAFRGRYAVMGGFENKQVIKHINTDDLLRRISPWTIIIKSRDVVELPPVRVIQLDVELDDRERKAYDLIRKENAVDLQNYGGVIPLTVAIQKVSREMTCASGFVYHYPLCDCPKQPCLRHRVVIRYGKTKENAVIAKLEEMPEEAVIVWTEFREEAASLAARLKAQGESVVNANDDPLDAARDFIEGRVRILIANPKSLGAGMNFQHAAVAIYMSHTYSYGMREQADKRIDRIGQTRPVVIYDVNARRTIDQRIHAVVAKKGDLAELVRENYGARI